MTPVESAEFKLFLEEKKSEEDDNFYGEFEVMEKYSTNWSRGVKVSVLNANLEPQGLPPVPPLQSEGKSPPKFSTVLL